MTGCSAGFFWVWYCVPAVPPVPTTPPYLWPYPQAVPPCRTLIFEQTCPCPEHCFRNQIKKLVHVPKITTCWGCIGSCCMHKYYKQSLGKCRTFVFLICFRCLCRSLDMSGNKPTLHDISIYDVEFFQSWLNFIGFWGFGLCTLRLIRCICQPLNRLMWTVQQHFKISCMALDRALSAIQSMQPSLVQMCLHLVSLHFSYV